MIIVVDRHRHGCNSTGSVVAVSMVSTAVTTAVVSTAAAGVDGGHLGIVTLVALVTVLTGGVVGRTAVLLSMSRPRSLLLQMGGQAPSRRRAEVLLVGCRKAGRRPPGVRHGHR